MADLKISQLPAASTPLAGTEEVPIVQGGVTDRVAVSDLTAGRAVAASSLTVAAGAVGTPSLTTAGDTNTGVYFPAGDTVAIAVGGAQALKAEAAAVTVTLPLVHPAGTVSAPSLTTTGDLNTGVYFPAADTVAITVGGSQALKAEATALTAASPIVLPAGSASAPALTTAGDLNTGVVFSAADAVGVTTGGTQRLTVDTAALTSTLPVVHPAGAAATPSVTTAGDLNTGAWFPAADTMALSTGGVEALRVTSAQAVIVGNGDTAASPAAATLRGTDGTGTNVVGADLTVQAGRGTGTGAGGYVRVMTSPAGASGSTLQTATERLRVTNAGRVGVGTTSPATTLDLAGAYSGNAAAVSALEIDCSAGNYFTKTINGASTFTVANVPASRAYAFTLELTHTSGAVTWFSGVEWPGGTTPTLTTGKTHLFIFVTDDGGTRWRGSSLVNYTN